MSEAEQIASKIAGYEITFECHFNGQCAFYIKNTDLAFAVACTSEFDIYDVASQIAPQIGTYFKEAIAGKMPGNSSYYLENNRKKEMYLRGLSEICHNRSKMIKYEE